MKVHDEEDSFREIAVKLKDGYISIVNSSPFAIVENHLNKYEVANLVGYLSAWLEDTDGK